MDDASPGPRKALRVHAAWSESYRVELPPGHRFPMEKYPALRRILRDDGLLPPGAELAPEAVSWEDLARVHTTGYLAQLEAVSLPRPLERRLGLPLTRALVRRARHVVQGTLDAAREARVRGLAANLAGGTHHAFADRGEGFCVLNDVAVAVRCLQAEAAVERVLVVDLDVHQGDGTAALFDGDPDVYTFSMHGERNYPFRKQRSSRDVPLPNGCGDAEYLARLAEHLPAAVDEAEPQLAFYLAGVDPHEGDRLGRLGLSEAGLAERDRRVLARLRGDGVPVVVLPAGGYGPSAEATARLHAIVHRVAQELEGEGPTWIEGRGAMGPCES